MASRLLKVTCHSHTEFFQDIFPFTRKVHPSPQRNQDSERNICPSLAFLQPCRSVKPAHPSAMSCTAITVLLQLRREYWKDRSLVEVAICSTYSSVKAVATGRQASAFPLSPPAWPLR